MGEPDLREFPITTTLAKQFPSYVPTLIATQPLWNGWLTFEADGSVLDKKRIATWQVASRTLAQLQIESRKNICIAGRGLRSGDCHAARSYGPIFDVMEGLMARQTNLSPPPLTREGLHTLAARLKEACAFLAELNLPDTLGHMDFNRGNVIGSSTGCVFGLGGAYVGHPFTFNTCASSCAVSIRTRRPGDRR